MDHVIIGNENGRPGARSSAAEGAPAARDGLSMSEPDGTILRNQAVLVTSLVMPMAASAYFISFRDDFEDVATKLFRWEPRR